MSDFISELKSAWVGARQRALHQSTRGIMTPEERRALEEEFDDRLNEVQAAAWDQCEESILKHIESNGTTSAGWPLNPYRKEQGNE